MDKEWFKKRGKKYQTQTIKKNHQRVMNRRGEEGQSKVYPVKDQRSDTYESLPGELYFTNEERGCVTGGWYIWDTIN